MPYAKNFKLKGMPHMKLYDRAYDLYRVTKDLIEYINSMELIKDNPDNFLQIYVTRVQDVLKGIES